MANGVFNQTHSQLWQLVVSASKSYCLDTFAICSEWNMNRSLTTATLQITKRAGASPQQHCEIRNERKLHNINIVNYKTSKSVTTTRLGIAKRAGAAPQPINRAQYEQELHHSAWRLHEVRPNFTTSCPESREARRRAAS